MEPLPRSLVERLSSLTLEEIEKLTDDERLLLAQALAQLEQEQCADPVFFAERRLGITPWSKQAEILRAVENHNRVAVRSGHKVGKLLADDTPVPTPEGWKAHGSLVVGDRVFDERGIPCTVTATMPWTNRPLMRITFEDGTYIDADERHEWTVHSRESRKRTYKKARTLETRELESKLTVPNGIKQISNWTIDLPLPLDTPEADLPLDPYLLGVWLGDGHSACARITTADVEIEQAFIDAGYKTKRGKQSGKAWSFAIDPLGTKAVCVAGGVWRMSAFRRSLQDMGLINNKHIPQRYLRASKRQRLMLLQGLMDTDGAAGVRGRCSFSNTRQALALGVLELARSLGIKARITEREARLYGRYVSQVWTVSWNSRVPVFRLHRKLTRIQRAPKNKANASRRIAIRSIEPIPGLHSGQCIEVDSPSHLYLAGPSMIPTHNSTSAAILALWWMHRYTDGRVVMTAPTGRQVRIVLWREVTRLYRNANPPIGGELHKVPDQGLQFDDGREIVGFSTDEPERIAGVSGAHVLYIVDEGSGIEETIYEAIEGNRAGGAKLVVFGNPTQTSGTFYEAFTTLKDRWHTIHVSSEQSPNVTGEAEVPGLATAEWVAEKLAEWGEHSPLFQVRVRGDFPDQSENAVIGIKLLEAACKRYDETLALGRLEIGVDVARFGDDETVIYPVRGNRCMAPIVLHSMDTVQVAGKVLELAKRLRLDEYEVPAVKVDVIGVGAGVADHLRTFGEIEVFDVNVAEISDVSEPEDPKYYRLRDQLWFGLKKWLENGGAIPDDGKLHADMLAPVYGFSVDGKIKVESKDDIKKRLKRSPDRADALALAVYGGKRTTMQNWMEAKLVNL